MPEPGERLPPPATIAWILQGVIACVGIVVAEMAIAGALDGLAQALVIAAGVAGGLTMLAVRPALSMRTWRYAVREEEIDVRHGWLVSTRTLIPMTRVQHVDTQVSAIGQLLGLSTLRVHTAAGKHEIPYVARETAAALRDDIARRAHVPDEL